MITNQLDRLKQDSDELEYFMQRLKKEGNEKRAQMIQRKKKYIEAYIQSMQLTPQKEEYAA